MGAAMVVDGAVVVLASGFRNSRARGLNAYSIVFFSLRLFKFNKLLYYLLR